MARYRKINVRIHGDAKFRRLSSPPPCGKYLWLVLLTHKRQASVPGLLDVGEATLAEELGWDLEGFRKAFREVSREGLAKADWSARLVWLPNAIKHNFPESPNVVRGWKIYWDELPECPLKDEAHDAISAVLAPKPAFLKAFLEACPKPSQKPFVEPPPKASPKPMANQEQEQEQEQEYKYTNTIQDLVGCGEPSPGGGACADQPPEQTLQAMAEAFLRDRNDCALRYGLPGQWRALDPLFAAFDGTWGRDERPRGAADPRHAIVAERLAEGFSVEELIEAVRGAKQDVHIARNRQFQVLRTILRDAAQVDKFRGLLKPANDSELAVEPVADTPSGTRWEEADAWSSA